MGEIINKAKGRIKKAVGDLTGNKELRRKGEDDETKGKVQGVAKAVKHAIKDVKGALKDAVK